MPILSDQEAQIAENLFKKLNDTVKEIAKRPKLDGIVSAKVDDAQPIAVPYLVLRQISETLMELLMTRKRLLEFVALAYNDFDAKLIYAHAKMLMAQAGHKK